MNHEEIYKWYLDWKFLIPLLSGIGALLWNYFQQRSIEALKIEVDKKLLVHRLQFETEFESYRKIWKGLTSLQKKLQFLRPIVDNDVPKGREYEEVVKERIPGVVEAANNLLSTIEENKPFYPSPVNERLIKVTKAINSEILFAAHPGEGADKYSYWLSRENRFQKINDAIQEACQAIRERVGT